MDDGEGEGGNGGGFLVDPIIKRLCYASPPSCHAAAPDAAAIGKATAAASFSHIAFSALCLLAHVPEVSSSGF